MAYDTYFITSLHNWEILQMSPCRTSMVRNSGAMFIIGAIVSSHDLFKQENT
jgi:hypothetical protein